MRLLSPLCYGPFAAILLFVVSSALGVNYQVNITLAITLLVAIWWVTEALPIPITSLIPFALFPLFGVLSHKQAASALGSHVILLLMGAFMLSKAVEKSGVHKRLALTLVNKLGAQNPKRIVLGFMLAAAFLSMWISNTATTLMLLPIALAVVSSSADKRFAAILLLAIAYAANIGGMGTPIGTPPNVIFMGVYEQQVGQTISFLDWMMIGVPIVVLAIPCAALWLTRGLTLNEPIHLPKVGLWTLAEKRVLFVFGLTAFAWIFRQAPYGGWTGLLDTKLIGDSTIALAAVVVFMLVPNGETQIDKKGNQVQGRLLDWQTAANIPWGMLLLFAGGICIAKAFQASGLSQILGDYLSMLSTWPLLVMIGLVALAVVFLTEVTSNTATTTLLMPVLAVAGVSAGIDPVYLMLPAALAASCAFMLPVATAPNAIVYSADKFTIKTMAREGFIINLIMTLIISFVCFTLL
ncbi:sodium:dicarboxylate symporter [Saccharobesus litoralis]|uniref:Sodium:dicarboxylate symporter n=1 Tax=Saccharobesus litoralis TaxID=2172099 RepID=A0A2S0VSF8_9ALTE|nr:SLC13 family permease [Saccharobesus litoralis]AWB67137.1 sodium:dicarboxylate symporter [Saccharobesus litoralis]